MPGAARVRDGEVAAPRRRRRLVRRRVLLARHAAPHARPRSSAALGGERGRGRCARNEGPVGGGPGRGCARVRCLRERGARRARGPPKRRRCGSGWRWIGAATGLALAKRARRPLRVSLLTCGGSRAAQCGIHSSPRSLRLLCLLLCTKAIFPGHITSVLHCYTALTTSSCAPTGDVSHSCGSISHAPSQR